MYIDINIINNKALRIITQNHTHRMIILSQTYH